MIQTKVHRSIVVYDLEIKKGIQGRGEDKLAGIEYCAGWHDHANMGISVMGVYDYYEDRYRVFCDDNKEEFLSLLDDRAIWVTFNGISFDNKVVNACWGERRFTKVCDPNYDILAEQWLASGLGSTFTPGKNAGFGLDATAQANLGLKKTGNGALAPVLWQRGQYGELVDYCLTDVHRTKRLFDLILNGTEFISPKTREILEMRDPFVVGVAA